MVATALDGFEELPPQLPPQSASSAQVLMLVQEDRLVAKNEEAVFQWVVRWQEAAQPTEAELLAAMKHMRFAAMDTGFVQATVLAWPALDTKKGLRLVLDSTLGVGRAIQRSGFGPRLVYVLGGTNTHNDDLSTVDVYDPLTDGWKVVSSMPTKRGRHSGGRDVGQGAYFSTVLAIRIVM